MGGFCCCPCPEEFEEYAHPNNPVYRQCLCLRYFFHQLFSGYTASFQRLEGRGVGAVAPPLQSPTPLTSPSLTLNPSSNDNITSPSSDTYQLVPRPPPPYSHLVSRRDKSTITTNTTTTTATVGSSDSVLSKKRSSTDLDELASKPVHRSESVKSLVARLYGSSGYTVTASEDEDVCPTCLEEYMEDNPKIVTNCNHHFHLSCIYEWMERSDNCPICGKEMEFCESP